MGKRIRVSRYTDEAVAAAASLGRDEYKGIKSMNKIELVAYLHRVYRRGYEKGHEDGLREAQARAEDSGGSEHTETEAAADGDV